MRFAHTFVAALALAAGTTLTVAAHHAAPTPANIDTALACQARVIDAVRKDAGGPVFVTFDRMPDVNGANVSGAAMDRSVDRDDRQMSYSCAGAKPTYAYRDGRKPVVMKGAWPSGATRACESAAGGGFAVASLSASDTAAEYIIGINGGGTVKICAMDKTRVVSVK